MILGKKCLVSALVIVAYPILVLAGVPDIPNRDVREVIEQAVSSSCMKDLHNLGYFTLGKREKLVNNGVFAPDTAFREPELGSLSHCRKEAIDYIQENLTRGQLIEYAGVIAQIFYPTHRTLAADEEFQNSICELHIDGRPYDHWMSVYLWFRFCDNATVDGRKASATNTVSQKYYVELDGNDSAYHYYRTGSVNVDFVSTYGSELLLGRFTYVPFYADTHSPSPGWRELLFVAKKNTPPADDWSLDIISVQ